jgi:translocation and assembly module TamA
VITQTTVKFRKRSHSNRLAFASAFTCLLLALPRAHAFGKKPATEPPDRVCPDLVFTHPLNSGLSANEKRLACGGVADKGSKPDQVHAWKYVPENQRRFHLSTFLQNRGYHHPVFTLKGNGVLWVDPGPLTRVTILTSEGDPPGFDFTRKREVVGQVLTPDLLSSIQKWAEQYMGSLGYPCAKADAHGDPKTGIVRVLLHPGNARKIGTVHESDMAGIGPGILRRYDAFRPGDLYNSDSLRLTERRAVDDGQVEGLHFRPASQAEAGANGCPQPKPSSTPSASPTPAPSASPTPGANPPFSDTIDLEQDVTVGKPRLLSLGVGANTEGVLLARASWRNTRLGRSASLTDVTLTTSTIHQLLTTYAEWYFRSEPSRLYFRPSASFEHIDIDPFATATGHLDLSPATTWDSDRIGIFTKLGPTYDYVRTFRGSGPPTSRFLSLEWLGRLTTHYFDFYQNSPRSGFSTTLTADVNSGSILSDFNAERFKLNMEGLWNLHAYDPPLFVVGIRGVVATTMPGSEDPSGHSLPPTFLQFLGGSQTLRGFGLQELPHSGVGTLSAAYIGTEFRFAGGIWLNLQPVLFIDVGALGSHSTQLDSPIYLSPGGGLRYESPFGVLRATLAHGYATGSSDPTLSHYQFFVSFGEEF